ncbi:MAG: AI-2E family transporter [Bdellovibrionia bacterium]
MKNKSLDLQFRRDLFKLGFLALALFGTTTVFLMAPSLSSPTLLALVAAMIMSPWVSFLERRGNSRNLSILIIYLIIIAVFTSVGIWGIKTGMAEWSSFKIAAPGHFYAAIQKMRTFELYLKSQYTFLESIHPTDTLLKSGNDTGQWFVDHGAALVGGLLTWVLITPPLTWVLLSEGKSIQRRFFQLVPNRYFEQYFLITSKILTGISDYLRAKLIEAVLVGLMVTVGLMLIKAPYAVVLGILAGVTNIIPYAGPILGAIPGIFLSTFNDGHTSGIIMGVVLVYVVANLVDMILIFPLVVAKLINLHPLLLIAIVSIGQTYYGLVGMLISVPIATALKVVIHEIYLAIYEYRPSRNTESPRLD